MSGTTNAVYADISANGPQDSVLVSAILEEAAMTLWRLVHMKHTPFALEPVRFDTGGTVRFGAKNVNYTFPRQGDLCWCLFAKIEIPGIFGADTTDGPGAGDWSLYTGVNEPYWTDAIGQYVLETVEFKIGGTIIDTLRNHYLYIWEEISGKPGKRLREMIGKYDTVAFRQEASRRSQILYVPLPFYFTENTGLALPIVSLQFHSISIAIDFAARQQCVVCPWAAAGSMSAAVDSSIYVRTDGTAPDTDVDLNSQARKLADTDLKCVLEGMYVYLDAAERSKFAHGQFEQVTSDVQYYDDTANRINATAATESSASVKVNLKPILNNVIMEYFIVVRQASKESANDHFNFDGPEDAASGTVIDPIRKIAIKFNANERVRQRDGVFFRTVTHWVHHTNIPSDFIYGFSYAVEPEDAQPTGGANHSRIDDVGIELELDPRLFNEEGGNAVDIFFIGRGRNLMRFKWGLITRKF